MFNWLSNLFNRTPKQLQPKSPHLEAIAVHNSSFFNNRWQQTQHSTMYQQSSWVHLAVSRIAEAGALVPLQVLRLDGETRLQIEQHPLEQLLDNPNPAMSRFELMESTLGFLELTGNAYWYLAGDSMGRPAQIWSLRPDRMTIVPHPTNYVAGYLYEVDGKQIPFDAIEVVHFKRWHPANDYYGLSPLDAARLAIESDRAMAQWNHNTFGNDNGVPAGIVNINDFVSDDDFDRIKREWRNSYGGAQRRTAFLRGGDISWHHIGLSHTDLDFLNGRIAHRDEILNIFGIPVGLVSENATEANATVAERQFIERTLYPKLVRIAQKITQELLPFYDNNTVAQFEDIRPTDTQARLDEIRTAQAILSINEIREQFYNMPTVAWGDVPVSLLAQPEPSALPAPDELSSSDENPVADTKAILDELAQWERFALNRIGKSEHRAFTVHHIPDDIAFEISASLITADNKDAIKTVFAQFYSLMKDESEEISTNL
ncbi:MAG: phage portal protein [Chloroflexota bacterium]